MLALKQLIRFHDAKIIIATFCGNADNCCLFFKAAARLKQQFCAFFFSSLTPDGPLEGIVFMGSRHPFPYVQQRDPAVQPTQDLIQWMYQMERDQEVRADDITVAPRHQVLYSAEQEHALAVIYYSNKSLAAPNFLWISISPWTYLH